MVDPQRLDAAARSRDSRLMRTTWNLS